MVIATGDWNSKVGGIKEGENGIVGDRAQAGEGNYNGGRFVAFCATNSLAITLTMYPHNDIHKYSGHHPMARYRDQIHRTAVNARFRRAVTTTRVGFYCQ